MISLALFLLLASDVSAFRFFYKSFSGPFTQNTCKSGTTIFSESSGVNNTCVTFSLGATAYMFVREAPWVNGSVWPGVYFEVSLSNCRGAHAGDPTYVPYDFAIQLTAPLTQQCWYFLPDLPAPTIPPTSGFASVTMNTSFPVLPAQFPTINSIWSLLVPYPFQAIASSSSGNILVSTFSGPDAGAAANRVAATLRAQPDYLMRQVSSLPIVLSFNVQAVAAIYSLSVALLMVATILFL